jgi:hypothetical protein
MKYIGQTGRNFRVRYREHIHAIRSNKATSKYAQHILETGHSYNTMENTLNILQFEKKSQKMNSLEQYYIYRLTKENLQLNDTHTNKYNPIFQVIADYYNIHTIHFHDDRTLTTPPTSYHTYYYSLPY